MARERGVYGSLLDEETWAFVDDTDSYYPPDAVDLTVAEQREVYNRMCRAFFAGYPEGVRSEDRTIDAGARDVPARLYRFAGGKPRACIVYFHGGGFVV
ncbi:MAG TPA: hypothetical protein VFX03_09880, partial [Thermomicrobiales bacterium]|nr:hypothetical protein [Thermomicrobiales bacterium]